MTKISSAKSAPPPKPEETLPYRLPEKISDKAFIEGIGAIYSLGVRGVYTYPTGNEELAIECIDAVKELPTNSKEYAEKHKGAILAAYKEYAIKNDPTGLTGIMKEVLGREFVRVHNLFLRLGSSVKNDDERSLTAKVAEVWALSLYEDQLTDDNGKPCENFFIDLPLPMDWMSPEAEAETKNETEGSN